MIANFQLNAKQHSIHECTRGTSTVTESILSGTENKVVEIVLKAHESKHLSAKL